MSEYLKPLPRQTAVSRPFWEAARRHELLLQRCENCHQFIYYPRDRCSNCLSARMTWQRCSGLGTVYSYTVVRRASSRAFNDAPYVLAIVELAEGPRMTTNLIAAPEESRVGLAVQVVFDDVTPEHTLIKFRPA